MPETLPVIQPNPKVEAALATAGQEGYQEDPHQGDYLYTAEDTRGNEVRTIHDGATGDEVLRSAVYHVQGGAEQGGKTFSATIDGFGNQAVPGVTIQESGKADRFSENPALAEKVIDQASSAIVRNSVEAPGAQQAA